jgi:predicted ribosome quality control (RQC) complex YloA/Tae2 family protein
MSYDSLVLSAVTRELQELIKGARVQRIFASNKTDLLLHLHQRNGSPVLLISCHPVYARAHLTSQRYDHLDTPSPFCMLLRKYLVGSRIHDFKQLPLERVLEIYFDPPEAMPPVKLVAEIMGRRSNLILVDQKELILGAAKTVSWAQNPRRAIQPGEPYRPVPPQAKLDPLSLQPEELFKKMEIYLSKAETPEYALVQAVMGLSPLAAREIVYRAGWDPAAPLSCAGRLALKLRALFEEAGRGANNPVLLEKSSQYAAYPLTHLPKSEQQHYLSMNQLLDIHYHRLISQEADDRLREMLTAKVSHRLARLDKKLQEQHKELEETNNAPLYRLYGETLLTYSRQAPRGAAEVKLPNPYHPEEALVVSLNPALSANENSQKYFHRYRKAVKARKIITERADQTREEIGYCHNLLFAIENADHRSLTEIRRELAETGYIREIKKKTGKKEQPPQPAAFKTSSGRTILVGLNNRQNDYITFKVASRRDTWLHTREVPGAHVLLKDAPYPLPAEDLEEAALLAAYFSRARESSAAAVDYTQVRHVRRAPGGKPGFVLYENYGTITVNPASEILKTLLKSKIG